MSMALLLTCRDVTDRLTDYQEGALSPLSHFRVRLHLAICKGCQHFLTSVQVLPKLGGVIQTPEDFEIGRAVLARAKARLGVPRPGRVPEPLASELAAGGDPLLRLQALTHLACTEGRLLAGEPYLPPEVLERLPSPTIWKWWTLGLRGARLAKLASSPDGKRDLMLLSIPGDRHFPSHRHLGRESVLILQGGLDDGLGIAEPGEWRHYGEGHPEHSPLSTPEGCWALILSDTGGVRLTGWRGWFQGWLE